MSGYYETKLDVDYISSEINVRPSKEVGSQFRIPCIFAPAKNGRKLVTIPNAGQTALLSLK
ncbi:hypothetical protein HI914_06747 [Erysiphe necator]|nr:hypothetical protein HI914_06747 [Erysiphe necator]